MIREAVQSSQIAAIGYDAESRLLEVEFKPSGRGLGSLYEYIDVDDETAQAFRTAHSLGSFLASRIKPLYQCVKVATILADGTEIPV